VAISRARRRAFLGVSSLIVVAILVLASYLAVQRVAPLLRASGCEAGPGGRAVSLQTGQAQIAATIAGVAQRHALPARAVTIAYAAALQESKLENLNYGNQDSVGVFQQRPSQGWGKTRQLEDPVYATSKFFGALVQVPGYLRMPVYRAAQAVQRSADGYAYNQYAHLAAGLARAFTGHDPHAVWCWYGQPIRGRADAAAAGRELSRTFGRLRVRASADPALTVRVSRPRYGWAVAAWLVSHAQQYRVDNVRYDGYRWTAAKGANGWIRYRAGTRPPGSVQFS
jgi:hypothetical protein